MHQFSYTLPCFFITLHILSTLVQIPPFMQPYNNRRIHQHLLLYPYVRTITPFLIFKTASVNRISSLKGGYRNFFILEYDLWHIKKCGNSKGTGRSDLKTTQKCNVVLLEGPRIWHQIFGGCPEFINQIFGGCTEFGVIFFGGCPESTTRFLGCVMNSSIRSTGGVLNSSIKSSRNRENIVDLVMYPRLPPEDLIDEFRTPLKNLVADSGHPQKSDARFRIPPEDLMPDSRHPPKI